MPVTGAVRRARFAQAAWAGRPLARRLDPIRALRHAIGDDPDRFASAVTLPQRSRAAETLAAEVLPLADACRFLEREAWRWLATRRLGRRGRPWWLAGVTAEVRHEPIGVVLIVGPSNYPLLLPGVQALQALAAGNAVLVKPGRGGTDAVIVVAEALARGGLPPDLFQVLPEPPEAVEAAIAAGIDKVVLTGSAATGAAVLAGLAPRLVPSVMELSGCDAVFIREDADLDRVVRALVFGLSFSGSATCIAPRRVFVHRTLAAELESRLRAAVTAVPARPVDPEAAARALQLAAEALSQGARLVAGAPERGPAMRPVVLAGAAATMALLREDVFAPVLALVEVKGDDDALERAAACPYALGASIFGGEDGALRLAARIRAGSVVINDIIVPTADPRLPFAGRGRSGFGATRGADGLLEMTVTKSVSVRRGASARHLDGARDEDLPLFRAYLRAVHGGALGGRVRGLRDLLRAAAGGPAQSGER